MTIEIRKDCPWFKPKRWVGDCKDCQTDGHYLCAGCRYIAPFEEMELSDNRMRYYPKEEKQQIENEKNQRSTDEFEDFDID